MTRNRMIIPVSVIMAFVFAACSTPQGGDIRESENTNQADRDRTRQSMGMGSGMMNRHHAQVPEEYAGLTNPISADEDSLLRGDEIYKTHCATCHGDYGNGDGPGGVNLDPVPAPIAHTSQMMGDAYLFWRITEGGIALETGMLPYRDILDEQSRWDVINYVRALGSSQVKPGSNMGGQPFDPAKEQAEHDSMLADAVSDGVITQNEAEVFDQVHFAMNAYLEGEDVSGMDTGPRADALPEILSAMVAAKIVTQDASSMFLDVHERLIEAGLMQ